MLVKEYIAVIIGGATGSALRFALSRWVQGVMHNGFPWGIFVVNILGSLAIGILYGILVHRYALGPVWRAAILIGLLGGFTTFSSFSLDTIKLIEQSYYWSALGYVVFTVMFGLIAAAVGIVMTRVAQ